MRFAGVCAPTITLLIATALALPGVSGCGKDPILTRAEKATKSTSGDGKGDLPPGEASSGSTTPGVPTEPTRGIPGEVARANIGDPQPGAPGAPASATAGDPTPGVPEPPKPGIPDAPPPGLPGSPQAISGPAVQITGVVDFPGYTKGKVRITAFDGDHSVHSTNPPKVVASADAASPGAFTLTVPENAGKLYIEAAIDEDNDGKPGPQDPQGNSDRFPVTVGASAIDGLTITLVKRPSPEKGSKSDF